MRESKVLAEPLHEYSSIPTEVLVLNKFVRSDIEIHGQFVDGEVRW